MWEKFFRIADHNLVIKGVDHEEEHAFPRGFKPFETEKIESQQPLFIVNTGVSVSTDAIPAHYTFLFEELNMTCEFVAGEEYYEFRMLPNLNDAHSEMHAGLSSIPVLKESVILKMPRRDFYYITNLQPREENVSEFRFLLWNAFGIASASHSSLAIHSSVILYKGMTVLFLGETGTGKSTHTQLWLKTIQGSECLNDDSPIVRIVGGTPICFGSPWSGKGNCFRNESYPIAAIVRLRQCLYNHIERLNKIEAFSALYPSCPPAFASDSELTDHLCNTLSILIEEVPVYLMDCLPDANAASLCCSTIFGNQDLNANQGHE